MWNRSKNFLATVGLLATVGGSVSLLIFWLFVPDAAYYLRRISEELETGFARARHQVLSRGSAYTGAGRELYEEHCASCHGFSEGGGRGPNLFAASFLSATNDAHLVQVTRAGIPGTEMPRSDLSLSDEQILQIVAYVRSRGAPEVIGATSWSATIATRHRSRTTSSRSTRASSPTTPPRLTPSRNPCRRPTTGSASA